MSCGEDNKMVEIPHHCMRKKYNAKNFPAHKCFTQFNDMMSLVKTSMQMIKNYNLTIAIGANVSI